MKRSKILYLLVSVVVCFLFLGQQAFALHNLDYGENNNDSNKIINYYRASSEGMVDIDFYRSGIFSYTKLSMQANSNIYSCGNWYIKNDTLYAISSKKPYFDLLHELEHNRDFSIFWYKYEPICDKFLLKNDSLFYLSSMKKFNVAHDYEDSIIKLRLKTSSNFKSPLNKGKVLSVYDGKVVLVEKQERDKYTVAIKHIDYISIYKGLDSVYVKDFERINSFQVIGSCLKKDINYTKSSTKFTALPIWYNFKLFKGISAVRQ